MGTKKISKNECYCKGPECYVNVEEPDFGWNRNNLDYRPCDYGSAVEAASLANCHFINVEPSEATHHHCSCVSGPNRTVSSSSRDALRNVSDSWRTRGRSWVRDIGRYRKDNWFDCHASTRTADNCYDRYASAFSTRVGKSSMMESSKRSFRNGITFSNDSAVPNVYRGLRSTRRGSVQYRPAAKANFINLFPYSNSAALRYQKGMPTRITTSVNTL